MNSPLLRWIARHLGTFILAFILGVVVWVSAVVTSDPNEERTFQPVPIEIIGQGSDLLIIDEIPTHVNLTLNAPRSIWEQLEADPERINAWIDLTDLRSGEHVVEVQTQVNISPFRHVSVDPELVRLSMEKLISRNFPVKLAITGEPPLGYAKGEAYSEPSEIRVSGPESKVLQVVEARSDLDISGDVETIAKTVIVDVLDSNEEPVVGINIAPKTVVITQPISLLGGFKNVVVKVISIGQVANGYRLTNITVSPPNVTLFSNTPRLLNEMPGFVDTLPVDLAGLSDDMEVNVGLNLPEGVEMVRNHSVLVQVSVAAIEGSITFTLPVDVEGLLPDLIANVAPETIDVIIAGPLKTLEFLNPEDFQVVLDLTGLPPGVYQRTPFVEFLPQDVRVQTTLPETIEVTISLAPTLTPTSTQTPGPSPTITLTPVLTSTGAINPTALPTFISTMTPKP